MKIVTNRQVEILIQMLLREFELNTNSNVIANWISIDLLDSTSDKYLSTESMKPILRRTSPCFEEKRILQNSME